MAGREYVTDKLTSTRMRRVRSYGTGPEMVVREMLCRMRFKFEVHSKGLPGHPDFAFPRRKKVIFVHGCFWHRHEACVRATMPRRNQSRWEEKFLRNVARDAENMAALQRLGRKTLVVWECELRRPEALFGRILSFLRA